jgi:hypothetical protein
VTKFCAHLDLVVIATTDEERLGGMEVNASDWAIVLVELINHGSHSVVAELEHSRVKARKHPWPSWVKGNA